MGVTVPNLPMIRRCLHHEAGGGTGAEVLLIPWSVTQCRPTNWLSCCGQERPGLASRQPLRVLIYSCRRGVTPRQGPRSHVPTLGGPGDVVVTIWSHASQREADSEGASRYASRASPQVKRAKTRKTDPAIMRPSDSPHLHFL